MLRCLTPVEMEVTLCRKCSPEKNKEHVAFYQNTSMDIMRFKVYNVGNREINEQDHFLK